MVCLGHQVGACIVRPTEHKLALRIVQVRAFVEAVVAKKGRIDHLVNCAGGLLAGAEPRNCELGRQGAARPATPTAKGASQPGASAQATQEAQGAVQPAP